MIASHDDAVRRKSQGSDFNSIAENEAPAPAREAGVLHCPGYQPQSGVPKRRLDSPEPAALARARKDRTMTSPQKLATQPKTFEERDNWIKAVLASELPDKAVRVLLAIGMELRVNTGRCDPSYSELATTSHVAERNLYRLIPLIEHKGWLAVQRAGGRHRNQYVLLNPAKAMAELNTANSAKSASPTLPKLWQSSSANKVAEHKERRERRKEKGAKTLSRAARSKRDKAPGAARSKESKIGSEGGAAKKELVTTDIDARFAEFMAIYPRQDAREPARKLFGQLVASGEVTADVLIAGARMYALAEGIRLQRPGQTRQHTAQAKTWLAHKRWTDPPPDGAVVDNQTGNVVAFQPQQRPRECVVIDGRTVELTGDPVLDKVWRTIAHIQAIHAKQVRL